jgi:hypothetical protein
MDRFGQFTFLLSASAAQTWGREAFAVRPKWRIKKLAALTLCAQGGFPPGKVLSNGLQVCGNRGSIIFPNHTNFGGLGRNALKLTSWRGFVVCGEGSQSVPRSEFRAIVFPWAGRASKGGAPVPTQCRIVQLTSGMRAASKTFGLESKLRTLVEAICLPASLVRPQRLGL